MKHAYKILVVLFISTFYFGSCTDFDDSLNIPSDLQVQNFIWKGLNLYYLWQGDVSDLSDNRFSNQAQLNDFLYTKGNPEALFQDLLFKQALTSVLFQRLLEVDHIHSLLHFQIVFQVQVPFR